MELVILIALITAAIMGLALWAKYSLNKEMTRHYNAMQEILGDHDKAVKDLKDSLPK